MEATAELLAAQHILIVALVVLAVGSVSGFVAKRLGVPDIVLFLIVGMALGPTALGLVDITADSAVNQLILLFGASYILFDGGASVRFAVLKQVWITIVVIATVGVVITGVVTGLAAYFLLGTEMIIALLLGAVLASTDPATLVPIFKQVPVKERVMTTVITESAFNDAVGAILTFTILAIAVTGTDSFSLTTSVTTLLWEASAGLGIGAVVGYVACLLVAHPKLGFLRDYLPIVTIMLVITAYMGALQIHGSGFMAVFVAGLFLGNRESFGFKLTHHEDEKVEEFILNTALILRMFIFILLGAQVNFELLSQYWLAALGIVFVFMFVARPLTVFICAGADRRAKWSMNELLFMCWTRETGVIPAALVGMLVGAGAPGAEVIAAVTFMAILLTILIQAPTTKWLATRLDLLVKK